MALVAAAGSAASDVPVEREQLIRGALVYKFGKFAEWSSNDAEKRTAFAIGVFRDPDFAALIRGKIQGKTLQGLPVSVRALTDPGAALECRVVFIAPIPRKELDRLLEILKGAPVLTVGSQPDFLEAGGIINLIAGGDKIGFAVSLAAADRAGVKLDARLLRLAQAVEEDL